MKRIIDFILWLIYPDKCIFCDEIIAVGADDRYVCISCAEKLEFYESSEIKNFSAVFEYKGIVKSMIHRFKFNYHIEYVKRIADFMEQASKTIDIKKYDCIVAVPMFYKKEKRRGYNQAQLLADALGAKIGIETIKGQLIRIKATKPQSQLNDKQRENNVKDAFAVKDKGYFKNKKIILIDDIYTTGSTVRSCIDVLKNDGAESIFIFVLSRTPKDKREKR